MRWLLALPLVLAACSSDPAPPVDSGPLDTGPADTGADAPITHDWPFIDAGEDRPTVDVGVDAVTKDWPLEDRPDVVAVADVPAEDAVDAGGADAGEDAVAVADAVDVQLVDVAADRPDVVAVDVPRDAGPVDGGPVAYDLEAGRAETSYRVIVRESYPSGAFEDCDSPPTSPSCSVAGGVLAFSVRACGVYLTGNFSISTTTPRSLSIFAGGGGSFAPTLRLEAGRRIAGSPARRSFHVQAAAAPFQGEPGLSGIPGRTVDPTLGDLWLLGCPSD